MRTVMRRRYYCDFCGKSGGSAGHMKRHEVGCTKNPNRICTAHQWLADEDHKQRPVAEAVAILKGVDTAAELKALRDLVGDCPMCILAAIRQCPAVHPPEWDEDGADFGACYDFNFKKELKDAWDAYHSSERAKEERHYVY